MIRKILTFNGLDNVSFTTEEYVPPEGGCVLFTDFSTVSPGTELFSIREGRPVQPGYIRTGHTADGQHCFVFPSMAESSAGHCNLHAPGSGSLLLPLPDGLPPELAGFLRFINIGLHPFCRRKPLPERVAVIGLGPVGNLAAQTSKLLGCDTTGVDPSARRRQRAGPVRNRPRHPAGGFQYARAAVRSGHRHGLLFLQSGSLRAKPEGRRRMQHGRHREGRPVRGLAALPRNLEPRPAFRIGVGDEKSTLPDRAKSEARPELGPRGRLHAAPAALRHRGAGTGGDPRRLPESGGPSRRLLLLRDRLETAFRTFLSPQSRISISIIRMNTEEFSGRPIAIASDLSYNKYSERCHGCTAGFRPPLSRHGYP